MSKVDWLYDRKSCVTCKKARGFMGESGVTVDETVNSGKVRFGEGEVLELLHDVEKLLVAKGSKVHEFDLKKDRPSDEVLLAHMLGPTGNLRAPTARIGKVMVIGFNEELYEKLFGS